MSNTISVVFTPVWTTPGEWYAALDFEIVNKSGAPLINPQIKIQLGQSATASPGSNYSFTQSGDILTGTLASWILPIENGGSATFGVGLNFLQGDNKGTFPVAYWVNGLLATSDGGTGPDVTPPSPPGNPVAIDVTANSISLTWAASADDTRVDHYVVHYTSSAEAQAVSGGGTSVTLSGLDAGTTWSIYVVAFDAAGNTSAPSSTIQVTTLAGQTDTTAPTVPTGLRITSVSPSSVGLSWMPSTDNVGVAGYRVKYAPIGSSPNPVTSSATACTITGLSSQTQYIFDVAAYDASGNVSVYSAPVGVSTPPAVASTTSFAPYTDVTMGATWLSGTEASMNTEYVTEAMALGVKKFHLAFLVWNVNLRTLVWGNQYFPYGKIRALTDRIWSAGGEPIVAFGGFTGLDPSVYLDEAAMKQIYLNLHSDFGIRHIDLDFETIGLYNYQTAFPAALEAQRANPQLQFSLTVPVATTGLQSEPLNMIRYARQIGLPLNVQIMTMDYGQQLQDMGAAAISAIEGTRNNLKSIYPEKSDAQIYAMIGVTPMIGKNDTPNEVFTFDNATQVANYAKSHGLSLVAMWALSRDFPGNGSLASYTEYAEQTQDYEFTMTFLDILKDSSRSASPKREEMALPTSKASHGWRSQATSAR